MQEETMINQEAQDHAVACALVARLLGQLTPSFMRLPVLNKNLDKPTQGMALDNIKRPPTQVGGDQRAIGLFLFIFDGDDEPFGFVGADIQPGTPHYRYHLIAASDAEGVGRPGMGGKVVGDVLVTLADSNVLIAADLRENLYTTEKGRGPIDKSRRAIERIRHDRVNPDIGMVGLEGLKQAEGEWFFGGIMRVGSRFTRPLFCGDTLLLEGLDRSIPRTDLRSGLIEDHAHGKRNFRGDQ